MVVFLEDSQDAGQQLLEVLPDRFFVDSFFLCEDQEVLEGLEELLVCQDAFAEDAGEARAGDFCFEQFVDVVVVEVSERVGFGQEQQREAVVDGFGALSAEDCELSPEGLEVAEVGGVCVESGRAASTVAKDGRRGPARSATSEQHRGRLWADSRRDG